MNAAFVQDRRVHVQKAAPTKCDRHGHGSERGEQSKAARGDGEEDQDRQRKRAERPPALAHGSELDKHSGAREHQAASEHRHATARSEEDGRRERREE